MNAKAMMQRVPLGTRLALTAALLVGVGLTAPRPAAANVSTVADLEKCVDNEWADYNSCLVRSSSEWGKKMCDVYFSAGLALCGAKYSGEFKKALETGF